MHEELWVGPTSDEQRPRIFQLKTSDLKKIDAGQLKLLGENLRTARAIDERKRLKKVMGREE